MALGGGLLGRQACHPDAHAPGPNPHLRRPHELPQRSRILGWTSSSAKACTIQSRTSCTSTLSLKEGVRAQVRNASPSSFTQCLDHAFACARSSALRLPSKPPHRRRCQLTLESSCLAHAQPQHFPMHPFLGAHAACAPCLLCARCMSQATASRPRRAASPPCACPAAWATPQ